LRLNILKEKNGKRQRFDPKYLITMSGEEESMLPEDASQPPRKRKYDWNQLKSILKNHPYPDSFALDDLTKRPWFTIIKEDQRQFDFKSNGVLIITKNDCEEFCKWSLDQTGKNISGDKAKRLVLEYTSEKYDFEIEFEHYQIRYIDSDWLILQFEDKDENESYIIFSKESNIQGLKGLFKRLNQMPDLERPNYYLIFIMVLVILVIIILMLSS
jgi:hypothetical protein